MLTSDDCDAFIGELSALTLLDRGRFWYKSTYGFPSNLSGPRDHSPCAVTITLPEQQLIVNDMSKDERFKDWPIVTNPDIHVRFYAGFAIVDGSGQTIGTIAIYSKAPGALTAEQICSLKDIARQAAAQIELRYPRVRPGTESASRRGSRIAAALFPLAVSQMEKQKSAEFDGDEASPVSPGTQETFLPDSPVRLFGNNRMTCLGFDCNLIGI